MIASRQATQGTFFTIEDPTGDIRGFVNLRGLNQETPFCEVSLLLIDPEDYQTPLAHAAFDFAADRVFVRHRLLKIMAIALEEEVAWRAFLTARGFQGSGVQREVLFTAGRYRNLESYALFEEDYQPHAN
jgi:RimJ/RimL family protein N-acetyltransferase